MREYNCARRTGIQLNYTVLDYTGLHHFTADLNFDTKYKCRGRSPQNNSWSYFWQNQQMGTTKAFFLSWNMVCVHDLNFIWSMKKMCIAQELSTPQQL